MAAILALMLALAEGPPLFYWGARPAVIAVEAPAEQTPADAASAQVLQVHAALDRSALVLRLTFDRPVRDAIRLPDGAPVSGRLRATLYLDRDADRATGLDEGVGDLRTGSDLRLEVGVIAMGEDPEEKRVATALITVTLAALDRGGRRKTLWRSDDATTPRQIAARGDWLELRLPGEAAVGPTARLILVSDGRALDGRLGR